MSANKNIVYVASSFLILPLLYLVFYAIHITTHDWTMEQWLPKWDRLLLLVTIVGLERLYTYRYAVSQRAVLTRDIIANIVNLYVTGAVAVIVVLPILAFVPQHFLGRKVFFTSPDQLGPFWLQMAAIMLSVSFFRYWMHRAQHENEFLWSLHAYHHRVTDLRASNAEVSNPIDFFLRNVLVFLVLGLVGFDPAAILISLTILNVTPIFSHCGADIKGGFLNYVCVTPEVHRWHHAVDVPKGYGHSCNYSVEFCFWDILFGTYYLPKKDGQPIMPERIGHPSGLPDEPDYLKLVFMPLGLYPIVSWFKRILRLPEGSGQQPAE